MSIEKYIVKIIMTINRFTDIIPGIQDSFNEYFSLFSSVDCVIDKMVRDGIYHLIILNYFTQ
jgi:hypothetical protein